MNQLLKVKTVTILDGETTSDAIDSEGGALVGIVVPTGLEGTTFTVKASVDNSTFYDYYNDSGSQVTITCGASRFIGISAQDFVGVRYLKLVGATQTGDITITFVLRAV